MPTYNLPAEHEMCARELAESKVDLKSPAQVIKWLAEYPMLWPSRGFKKDILRRAIELRELTTA